MSIYDKLSHLLNRKRLGYAWIAGGALWMAWLSSLLLGSGGMDLAGQVIGADYLQFYTAGYTLRLGESARLYDILYQSQLQQDLIPRLQTYYAFITPPFLTWLFAPLSVLPYAWSFAAWSLLGLGGLATSLRLLGARSIRSALAWSLTWFPIFASISYGQNSLLSLTILSLTYWLWRKDRPWTAGLACSLLMFKPQLVIGIAVLWLLDARKQWRALAGLLLGSGLLAFLCFWQLPAASWAYLEFSRTVLPNLPAWFAFPLWNLHTVRGFWLLLLPGQTLWADLMAATFALVGVWGFARFARRMGDQPPLLFAGAVCLTLWVTPHAMIYDWALLLIPAVLLWEHVPQLREGWKVLYAAIWLVTFISFPLTVGQLAALPFAVQISVPVFLGVTVIADRWLRQIPKDEG